MEYHEPDRTWSIWCQTYESYVETFVVKGRFHSNVPEDIVKSYKVAEYIMAHAYYFYPMYDEAMIRLTGIFEMAIKKRCIALNIPLKELTDKGILKEKTLSKLIKDVTKKERGKQMHFQLNWARNIRNLLAHPKDYGFSGGNIHSAIQEIVNIINLLFIPENLLISFFNERKRMAALLKLFSKGLWVLTYKSNRYLVAGREVVSAIRIDNKWKYLVVLMPVYHNFSNALVEHKYLEAFRLLITDVKIGKNSFTATDARDGLLIMIEKSHKDKDLETYRKHLDSWQKATKENQVIYLNSNQVDTDRKESVMQYEWLYKT